MKLFNKSFVKYKILTLEDERDVLNLAEGFWPIDTFAYTKCVLALAIVELKIALWRLCL